MFEEIDYHSEYNEDKKELDLLIECYHVWKYIEYLECYRCNLCNLTISDSGKERINDGSI